MCGIIAAVDCKDVASFLLRGLKYIEYRGYDSSGIAVTHDNGILCRRSQGKLSALEAKLLQEPMPTEADFGIGHTRWATHGAPIEKNAHPHVYENIALVHNGIIENFHTIRQFLKAQGFNFTTDTDTEAALLLVSFYLQQKNDPFYAVQQALKKLEGLFSMVFLFQAFKSVIGVKQGNALIFGHGLNDKSMFLASDVLAIGNETKKITFLEEGDSVILEEGSVHFYNARKVLQRKESLPIHQDFIFDKGQYRHFMAKEIHEQPEILNRTLTSYVDPITKDLRENVHNVFRQLEQDWSTCTHLTIIACGTSFYAAMIAKYWLETLAHINVEVDIASEFRYRKKGSLLSPCVLFLSQSGETADTLSAMRFAKKQGSKTLGIVNVDNSSIAREADACLAIYAGFEIGVASTKAFTAQLCVLAIITLFLAQEKETLTQTCFQSYVEGLFTIPHTVVHNLKQEEAIISLAKDIVKTQSIFYLGRGIAYPLALEAALKLKEVSYIHAEGYPAGELKHGPIALIDENMPVILLAPYDDLFEKTLSNAQEITSRGGKILFVSSQEGLKKLSFEPWRHFEIPCTHSSLLTPFAIAPFIQLLAYHVAVLKGTDVDQPRNLAKSVTVE